MKKLVSTTAVLSSLIILATSVMSEEAHLLLGGEDDSASVLYYPRQIEEGPDGNLYVLDTGDSYIKVFSPAGEFLRGIGGPGEGPGEFQRIDGASFGFTKNKELFFTEFIGGHHWISVLGLDGRLVRVLSPQVDVVFGVEEARSVEGGGYVILLAYNSRSRSHKDFYLYDTPQSLVEIDSTGAIVSEIIHSEHTTLISYLPNGATTNLPFTPTFAWAVTGDNQVVWSDGMSPVFKVIGFSGELIREVTCPLPEPLPVSKSDLEEWRANREETIASRNSAWWHEFGRVVAEYTEPLYNKPVLWRITATPAGNWLVEGNAYSDSEESLFWLLDTRGNLLGSVSAPVWGVRISESFLLFFSSDEDDLPAVHAISRSAGELETLELLADI